MDGRAQDWLDRGDFFTWSRDDGVALRIFHTELGDRDAPLVVLVHGFPTCSIDWYDVAPLLASDRRVCLLDFPGFGFSDKPRDGHYSLTRDCALLEHFVHEVIGVERGAVVAHDRGDSVALQFARRCQSAESGFDMTNLVLSNANMFLPLSNLTDFQRQVLHADTAGRVLEVITPDALAAGMGDSTFTPRRPLDDPAIGALAQTFAYNDGTAVLHETIQYLVERSEHEEEWLEALSQSSIPTTVIWGLYDTVSPLRVANHIWHTYLSTKSGNNELWYLPAANHYLQHDNPEGFAAVVRHALAGDSPAAPGAAPDDLRAPIFVDRSRRSLRPARDVLASP